MSNTSHLAWRCRCCYCKRYADDVRDGGYSRYTLSWHPHLETRMLMDGLRRNHLHLSNVSPLHLGRTPTRTLVLGELCGVTSLNMLINTWIRQATKSVPAPLSLPHGEKPVSLAAANRTGGQLFGNQSSNTPQDLT